MHEDVDRCVRAMRAKDARFDGWFFSAVVTTGIYCRPSCPVAPPKICLPFRAPLCSDNLFRHLVATAVPGLEEWHRGAYRRSLDLPHGPGLVALRPRPDHVACRLTLNDLRDLSTAANRCRRLLDLDADPVAIDDLLGSDPVLAPLVDKNPGSRVPRTVDPAECALRTVLGARTSTAAARAATSRLVAAYGTPITDPDGGLSHLFPDSEALAAQDAASMAVPLACRTTFAAVVAVLATGELDLSAGSDWQRARTQLSSLPGLEPRTVETIAMHALGDPDAFAPTDDQVRQGAHRLGLDTDPAALSQRSSAWRPWRSYAAQLFRATTTGTKHSGGSWSW